MEEMAQKAEAPFEGGAQARLFGAYPGALSTNPSPSPIYSEGQSAGAQEPAQGLFPLSSSL